MDMNLSTTVTRAFYFLGFTFSLLLAFPLWARFYSPFPSTIKGVCLPNAHQIDKEGYLYRSMEPYDLNSAQEIQRLGVEKVLIFKNDHNGEVEENKARLRQVGIKEENMVHIPFPYKDMNDFTQYCKMVVKGLQEMRDSFVQKKKTLLHCTVGEDRTGLLSGLFQLLIDEKKDHKRIFFEELCQNGYGHGNPEKPLYKVVYPIRKNLTPLYLKMAYLIQRGRLSLDRLEEGTCLRDPIAEPSFRENSDYRYWKFRCSPRPVVAWQCDGKNYPLKD